MTCYEDELLSRTRDTPILYQQKPPNIPSTLRYGGNTDPCTLSLTNDKKGWERGGLWKDPSECQQNVFFLWDEPYTHPTDGFKGGEQQATWL